jgi:ribosomal protein S14
MPEKLRTDLVQFSDHITETETSSRGALLCDKLATVYRRYSAVQTVQCGTDGTVRYIGMSRSVFRQVSHPLYLSKLAQVSI